MSVLSGIVAGAAHVISGPDHLAGVAPLAVDRKHSIPALGVGASWGLGHAFGVAVLGFLSQVLLTAGQVEIASQWADRLVGILLIGLGALTVRRARTLVIHEHLHDHDGEPHAHLHVHFKSAKDSGEPDKPSHHGHDAHHHYHTAMGVGLLHGIAGGGHFWGVLPSLALSPSDAGVYIAAYGVSTIAVMALAGAAFARIVTRFGAHRIPRILNYTGWMTVAVGIFWLVSQY